MLEQIRFDECNKIFHLPHMAKTIFSSAAAGRQLSPRTDTQVHKAKIPNIPNSCWKRRHERINTFSTNWKMLWRSRSFTKEYCSIAICSMGLLIESNCPDSEKRRITACTVHFLYAENNYLFFFFKVPKGHTTYLRSVSWCSLRFL